MGQRWDLLISARVGSSHYFHQIDCEDLFSFFDVFSATSFRPHLPVSTHFLEKRASCFKWEEQEATSSSWHR